MKILSLKEATKRELQEPKTTQIECHTANGRVELNVVDCDQKSKTEYIGNVLRRAFSTKWHL